MNNRFDILYSRGFALYVMFCAGLAIGCFYASGYSFLDNPGLFFAAVMLLTPVIVLFLSVPVWALMTALHAITAACLFLMTATRQK